MAKNKDVATGLRNIALFVVAAFILILIGTSGKPGWLIPVTPLLMGAFGYIVSGGGLKATAGFAAIGLLAGITFYFAI